MVKKTPDTPKVTAKTPKILPIAKGTKPVVAKPKKTKEASEE